MMGEKGRREIERIDERTVILTETTSKDGKRMKKRKLVKLNPERLSWTNTHLSGRTIYSQFLYEIIPEGKSSSRLHFTGLQLEYSDVSPKGMASALRKEDSRAWKLLAKAMEEEISSKKNKKGS